MKTTPWLFGILLGTAATLACAEETPPDPTAAWQQHWQQMEAYHQAWMQAKTPDERQKLREQHWQSMHSGFGMMGGCPMAGAGMPAGGMGPGAGMHGGGMGGMHQGSGMGPGAGMPGGPGAMTGQPTAEQMDQRIGQMEKMLEQMRAHRAMLDKQ